MVAGKGRSKAALLRGLDGDARLTVTPRAGLPRRCVRLRLQRERGMQPLLRALLPRALDLLPAHRALGRRQVAQRALLLPPQQALLPLRGA
jgi:hypothetical protein